MQWQKCAALVTNSFFNMMFHKFFLVQSKMKPSICILFNKINNDSPKSKSIVMVLNLIIPFSFIEAKGNLNEHQRTEMDVIVSFSIKN